MYGITANVEPFEPPDVMAQTTDDPPLMQRLYNRIWLLAGTALLFFFVTYVVWGLVDIVSVPTG